MIFGKVLPIKPSIFNKWFQDFTKKKMLKPSEVSKKLFKIKNAVVRWWKIWSSWPNFSWPNFSWAYLGYFWFWTAFLKPCAWFQKKLFKIKNTLVRWCLLKFTKFFITVLGHFWFWTFFWNLEWFQHFFLGKSRKINRYLMRFVVNLLFFKAKP